MLLNSTTRHLIEQLNFNITPPLGTIMHSLQSLAMYVSLKKNFQGYQILGYLVDENTLSSENIFS